MSFKDKRVFISGGSGVIGLELVKELHRLGAKILVGDLKSRPREWPADILYRKGDLNYITKEELVEFEPEYFFHLAATFERSTEGLDFWNENYHHNISLSHHLMTIMKDLVNLKKVVFASSYLVYDSELYSFTSPAREAYRLAESDQTYPRNLCGMAKFSHEVELKFLEEFKELAFKSVSARIFRSYGKNSRDIISRWIRALLKGERLTVYKKEGLFDYIYAGEVANGLIKLALSDATGSYNLGNDNARRVEEVLEILKKYFPSLEMDHVEIEIPYEGSQANMERFREVTGWVPTRQLEDVIPEIIEYEKGRSLEVEDETYGILISSVSKKIPLVNQVKKAARKIGLTARIIGGDSDRGALAYDFVDKFWHMPLLRHLDIEDLIDFCNREGVRVIIPTRDGELEYFAQHSHELRKHDISVMVSEVDTVQICLDKLMFFQKLKEYGFNGILTTENIDELECSRFVVKERYGAGSTNIGIGLSKPEALEHSKNLKSPIFQPMIDGYEISIDTYVDKFGKSKGVVLRRRNLVVGGESQITTTFRNPELESLCKAMVEKLNIYGHVVLQAIVDPDNIAHFIECNSRFGGASTLSTNVGLDSFYWFLLESLGEDISLYPFGRATVEKKQIRYMEDLIVDTGI